VDISVPDPQTPLLSKQEDPQLLSNFRLRAGATSFSGPLHFVYVEHFVPARVFP